MKSSAGSGADVSNQAFEAKLLASALQPVLDGKRLSVLDLGSARSATIDFFSGSMCRLGIADITAALPELDAEEDKHLRQQQARALLPQHLFSGADLVLCWDLFNYMRPQTISALMFEVSGLLRSGSLLHALIANSSATLPALPVPLELQATFGWLAPTQGAIGQRVRPAPRYPTGELLRLMPDFRVERSTLMRNGVQEYLFRF